MYAKNECTINLMLIETCHVYKILYVRVKFKILNDYH